jgi:hypothetical protein
VIAIVDDGVILQSEYEEARAGKCSHTRAGTGHAAAAYQRSCVSQIMENLIVESLQLQLADACRHSL